jgi:hypothetical protein
MLLRLQCYVKVASKVRKLCFQISVFHQLFDSWLLRRQGLQWQAQVGFLAANYYKTMQGEAGKEGPRRWQIAKIVVCVAFCSGKTPIPTPGHGTEQTTNYTNTTSSFDARLSRLRASEAVTYSAVSNQRSVG